MILVNNRFIRQTDGCLMSVETAAVLPDIYVCKKGEDIAAPVNPDFVKCFVNGTHVRKKNNNIDKLKI